MKKFVRVTHKAGERTANRILAILLVGILAAMLDLQPALAAPKPINIVCLGDSIIWGQGLPESMKFRTLVAGWLQEQYHGTRAVNVIPTRAHSGAVTGWGKYESGYNGDPDTDRQHTDVSP